MGGVPEERPRFVAVAAHNDGLLVCVPAVGIISRVAHLDEVESVATQLIAERLKPEPSGFSVEVSPPVLRDHRRDSMPDPGAERSLGFDDRGWRQLEGIRDAFHAPPGAFTTSFDLTELLQRIDDDSRMITIQASKRPLGDPHDIENRSWGLWIFELLDFDAARLSFSSRAPEIANRIMRFIVGSTARADSQQASDVVGQNSGSTSYLFIVDQDGQLRPRRTPA